MSDLARAVFARAETRYDCVQMAITGTPYPNIYAVHMVLQVLPLKRVVFSICIPPASVDLEALFFMQQVPGEPKSKAMLSNGKVRALGRRPLEHPSFVQDNTLLSELYPLAVSLAKQCLQKPGLPPNAAAHLRRIIEKCDVDVLIIATDPDEKESQA